MSSPRVSLSIPLAWFALSHLGMIVAAGVVLAFLEIEAPGSFSFVFVIFAAAIAGQRFVVREQRLPTSGERWKLTSASAAVAIAVELLAAWAVLSLISWAEGGQPGDLAAVLLELPLSLLVGVALVFGLIMMGFCYLGYGPMTRTAHKQLVKQGKLSQGSDAAGLKGSTE